MLRRENELRLSPNIQEMYRKSGYCGYVEVTIGIQKQVAQEFGIEENICQTLLQCAETLVTEESDVAMVKELSLYRKYNRMKDGNLMIGDKAPSLTGPLYRFNIESKSYDPINFECIVPLLNEQNLYSYDVLHTSIPVVIVASSHS
jgi:hypothetical protein